MGKYHPRDHFYRKAKQEGFRARSAFKLDEIARRFRIFRAGQVVVDLGAAPGAWLQILSDLVGPKGEVIGVDVVPIRPLGRPNVKTAALDVLSEEFWAALAALHPGPYDVVVSDLAPKTTGIRLTDEARSIRLATLALDVSRRHGKPGSTFVAKLFMGSGFEEFRDEVRTFFDEVKVVRPEATRGASVEVYLVGLSRRAAAPG